VVKMDESELDKRLNWIYREEDEPLSRNLIK